MVIRVGVIAWGLCSLIVAGCSSSFPILVKVDPTVDVPKAVDIVWVLTESDAVVGNEIMVYKEKGMMEYFRSGRSNLTPGAFRTYQFLRPGEQWIPGKNDLPLEVRSEPGATRHKLYGPYNQPIPSGALKGFLLVEYGKDAEEAIKLLPMMIYPKLPTYHGYYDTAPAGISIEISRDKCWVIPYEKESPEIIKEAELARGTGSG